MYIPVDKIFNFVRRIDDELTDIKLFWNPVHNNGAYKLQSAGTLLIETSDVSTGFKLG